jgi:predicted DNA-binding ribbon-helix-helix protein
MKLEAAFYKIVAQLAAVAWFAFQKLLDNFYSEPLLRDLVSFQRFCSSRGDVVRSCFHYRIFCRRRWLLGC